MEMRGFDHLQLLKNAYKALTLFGSEFSRETGDWCMKKDRFTTMVELNNVHLIVAAPQYRWHTLVRRGTLLETLDVLLGLNPGFSPRMIKFYSALLEKYRDIGFLPYQYGSRIMGLRVSHPSTCMDSCAIDQFSIAAKKLRDEPTTRQASVMIRRPRDLLVRDTPCTWGYHFQLTDSGRLDISTFMRSQDLLYGLPYDLFSQSMILEQMSLLTGFPMGKLHEHVVNFHYYGPDEVKLAKLYGTPGLHTFTKNRKSELLVGQEELRAKLINYLDEHLKEGIKNRYLTVNELHPFLSSEKDYWFDYLKLIGVE